MLPALRFYFMWLHAAGHAAFYQGARKDGRGNEPLPLRNLRCAEPPRRFLEENVRSRCRLLQFELFMDEEVDELGDHFEDLGIEIGIEFPYYVELCETFWRIKKLGSRKSCSSLVQAVATAHLDLQVIK